MSQERTRNNSPTSDAEITRGRGEEPGRAIALVTASPRHSDSLRLSRRRMLLAATGATALVGCGSNLSETTEEMVDSIDTSTLESGKLALRGFAIVSYMVGTRVVMLPSPGVRILGVVLIFGTIATKLAIEYLDDELKKRYHTDELSEEDARQIEMDGVVKFQTEDGETESVRLSPNQYTS